MDRWQTQANLYGKARLVGYALYRVDTSLTDVPWHRVINASCEISYSSRRHGADYLSAIARLNKKG